MCLVPYYFICNSLMMYGNDEHFFFHMHIYHLCIFFGDGPKCFAHFLIKLFVFLLLSYSYSLLFGTLFSLLRRHHVLHFLPVSWYTFSVFSTILLLLCSSFKSFILYTSFLSHLTYCHDFRNCCGV